jgi:hypothetical protein
MVHPQVLPTLALGLVAMESAKMLFIYRLAAHCLALICAVVAALAAHFGYMAFEIGAAGAAIVSEFAALYLHHRALEFHSRGRQNMRRLMLLDALHPEEAPRVLEKLVHHFSEKGHRQAKALLDLDQQLPEKARYLSNYYWSDKPPGLPRLRDHLFESAIFSHHLYTSAWKISLGLLAIMLVFAAAVLAILIKRTTGLLNVEVLGRVLIALVAFLPACQEVDHLLLYRMARDQLNDLLKHVEALYAISSSSDELNYRLLADFGDYGAATVFAPPIRTLVYKRLAGRLAKEFDDKMHALGQGTHPQ